MKRMHVVVVLALLVSACTPLSVVSTGAMATSAVAERRGAGSYFSDSWIESRINAHYLMSEDVRVGNVTVDVYKGRVLLMGTAMSQNEINEAIRLAKSVDGVKKVSSELKVQYAGVIDVAKDATITTQVKSLILANDRVRGLDIHVTTVKEVVYLTGAAASVAERDEAIRVARSVSGVQEVVSYVEVDPTAKPVESPETAPPQDNRNDSR